MKKNIQHLVFGGLFAAILIAGSAANAQVTPTTTPKPKRDWYPFGASVASVDTTAKTISLKKKEGERVLKTDAKTTLEQNGKPATLADVKPGNYLHGKLHKNAGGEEVLLDAKIELEAPLKIKGTNAMPTVATPITSAAADDMTTNAPVKKKKKKASTATNAPAIK